MRHSFIPLGLSLVRRLDARSAWVLTQMIVDGVPEQLVASRAPTPHFSL